MSGRVEQVGIDQFIYTEVTVGLKKQGTGKDDAGAQANKELMADGSALAKSRAKAMKEAVLRLKESKDYANSLQLQDIAKNYQYFNPDMAGFSKLPTWSTPNDIQKHHNKSGYVLILDRDLRKGIGRTVIHFKKIPSIASLNEVKQQLLKALENLSNKNS